MTGFRARTEMPLINGAESKPGGEAHTDGFQLPPEQVFEGPGVNYKRLSASQIEDLSDAGPKFSKPRQAILVQTISLWYWELGTWVLGTASFVATLVLLIVFNGCQLWEWQSHISINTVVAILSQVTVSALLVSVSNCIGQLKWIWFHEEKSLADLEEFDRASRGPQGSLLYLLNIRRLW